jgi:Protein of unknown function (DUF3040)
MSLAPEEQHELARIENRLRFSDPKLALRLEAFARKPSRGRGPARERLSPWRPRAGRLRLLLLVVAAVVAALCVIMIISSIDRPAPVRICGRAATWLARCQPLATSTGQPRVPHR